MTCPRTTLVATARRMAEAGLTPNRSGNASVRCEEAGRGGFLVTPSGMDPDDLTPDDAVACTADGTPAPGARKPSSEWRFHADIYRNKPEIRAVVHTHSPHATAVACTGRSIPAFHYMVAAAGGNDVPLAEYATFGTQALSNNVLAVLQGRTGCLIAQHGAVACGPDLDAAYRLAVEIEDLARKYTIALALGGVQILSDREMEAVLAQFRGYGQ